MTCAAEPPAGLHSPGVPSSPSTARGEVHRGRSVSTQHTQHTHKTTLTPTLTPNTPMNLACFLAPANLGWSIKCAFVCGRTHTRIPPRSISLRMETKHAPHVHQCAMLLPPQPPKPAPRAGHYGARPGNLARCILNERRLVNSKPARR